MKKESALFHFPSSHLLMCGLHPGLPGGAGGGEAASQCKRHERRRSGPWVGRIPGEGMVAHPGFLPGRFHGQRSLAGDSPRGRNKSDMAEHASCCHILRSRYSCKSRILFLSLQKFSCHIAWLNDTCERQIGAAQCMEAKKNRDPLRDCHLENEDLD